MTMANSELLPAAVLRRKAVVYVRQSTQTQVQTNLESQRRQYDLVEEARRRGFSQIEVIDDDLGRSASGMVARPGFDRLVAWLCAGEVGAVLCFDASRLARNGRDWHHLLELCGLVEARVIDLDGVYDPCRPNDRLLLGMKGSISEFELGVLKARMFDAARAKAHRGELRISVPVGYIWHREVGLGFDPDVRLQEAIHLIFERFRKLSSARQVLLSLAADGVHFPRPSDGKKMVSFDWTPIRYRNVISVLKNPFYAGVYVYGKSEKRTTLVEGRLRKSYGHGKPVDQWEVMIKDHHEAYIGWAEFERNQNRLAVNAYGRVDGVKSGRGGRALLSGMLCCGRCGRRLTVAYVGRGIRQAVYRCDRPNMQLAQPRCFTFGGRRPDEAIARELLRAVEPLAIEAALQAERRHMEVQAEQRRIVELDLQQARYEAALAERRYAACDPDHRLIAAQLEKSWEAALERVRRCEQRLAAFDQERDAAPTPDLAGLAEDLQAAWNADGPDPEQSRVGSSSSTSWARRARRGQVHIDLSAVAGIAQEGAQSSRHELGSLPVQSRCLVSDEAQDIGGAQTRELHWLGAETMPQKVTNERDVVDDRGGGQGAPLAQVHLVCVCTAINRCSFVNGDLFGGNHALAPQEVHQVRERCTVPATRPPTSRRYCKYRVA